MLLHHFMAAGFALVAQATPLDQHVQQPILTTGGVDQEIGKAELIAKLKEASIIPTILDAFIPSVAISVFWENSTAEVGNEVSVGDVQKAPDVQFITYPAIVGSKLKQGMQLTLALTDPDAPSRQDPKWSQVCHWIATGVQLTQPTEDNSGLDPLGFSEDVEEIMPYKAPGPPPKTGRHRYVFVALAPKNATTETLSLSKPGERKGWGYGQGKREGVREWAEENGLEVIGANFVYARNEEQ